MNVNDLDLEKLTNQLNDRPRKSLGFPTPNEVFNLARADKCLE
jgi:IS30 family transposase